jgi:hypothetical protein
MISTVGVFAEAETARKVNDLLAAAGIPEDRRILLLPGTTEEDLAHVPVTGAEAPVMGKVIGGLVGGSLGVGAAAGIAAIPGVGPVAVIGILGLALLGVGGTAAGVKIGDLLDDALYDGLPMDELFVYEDALRKGRSVVIALVESDEQAEQARKVMAQHGAETIDAARDQWWIGLRSAEQLAYESPDEKLEREMAEHDHERNWEREEAIYRAGFESALLPGTRGRAYDEVVELLRGRHPGIFRDLAFRRGYERGQVHDRKIRETHRS